MCNVVCVLIGTAMMGERQLEIVTQIKIAFAICRKEIIVASRHE